MKHFFIFILLFYCFQSFGQVSIEKTIAIEADNIFSDNFDNLYILTENSLIKFDSEGKSRISYFPKNGELITYVDTRNSLKVILFFEDQNMLVVLDNKLSKISNEIYLDNFGVYGNAVVCGSAIGGYWIYDNISGQLLRLNSNFSVDYKKDLNISEEIISIRDNNSNVFLQKGPAKFIRYNFNNGQKEVVSFERTFDSFSFTDEAVVFYDKDIHSIVFFNQKNNTGKPIKLPENIDVTNAVYGKTKVFFFDKAKVYIASTKVR